MPLLFCSCLTNKQHNLAQIYLTSIKIALLRESFVLKDSLGMQLSVIVAHGGKFTQ